MEGEMQQIKGDLPYENGPYLLLDLWFVADK